LWRTSLDKERQLSVLFVDKRGDMRTQADDRRH
jgi:hypothetical protein